MKKSVFTTLNIYLPAAERDADALLRQCRQGRRRCAVLRPVGHRQDDTVGRSEPHADRRRRAWLGQNGVFNFEGGCYAKCIKLSREAEPEIYAATDRFGAVLENVVFDPATRICDFDGDQRPKTPARPIRSSSCRTPRATGRAGQPKNIIFLTADAFGVMPPIAKLTPAQAMYHFLSGYTAKVAGTEKGLTGSEADILDVLWRAVPAAASLATAICLRELIGAHDVDCWLVNTGWTGGIYGVGRRMPIKVTRTLLAAALDGSLKNVKYRTDPYFGFPCRPRCRASNRICSIR